MSTPGKIKVTPEGLKIKFDSKNFVKESGAFISDLFDFKFGSALKSAKNAISAETPAEGVAFTLILGALKDGAAKIFKSDSRFQEHINNSKDAVEKHQRLAIQFKDLLIHGNYEIGSEFFSSPHELVLLKPAKEILKNWLMKEHAYSNMTAFNLSETFPRQFLRSLVENENDSKEAIDKIKTALKSEFTDAFKALRNKESYHAKLLEGFYQPAFDDAKVLLHEMYVEPNLFIHQESITEKELKSGKFLKLKSEQSNYPYFRKKNFKKNIHQFFLEWLKGKAQFDINAEKSQLMILLGQPGQGKTSFCQRTLHQLLEEGNNVLENVHFLRLRNIDEPLQMISDPIEYLREEINDKQFNKDGKIDRMLLNNGLLILDGLDELFMSQGLTEGQIHDFINKLKKQIEEQRATWNLRVLITSRLNYINFSHFNAKDSLVIKLAELTENQQIEWLSKYKKHYPSCKLKSEKITEINKGKDKTHTELKKLLNQPILLQLMASAGFEIDLKTNRAKIYETLFDNMLNRKWSKEGQLDMLKGIEEGKGKKLFRRFLQSLALEIFQSEHEYITREAFQKEGRLKSSIVKLKRNLGQKDIATKDLIKNLLVSFYFQEVNREKSESIRQDDHERYAYEFLHKSLMEYLVAEKVWNSFQRLMEKDNDEEYIIENREEVLEKINPIIGEKIISGEIAEYVYEIIQNEKDEKYKKGLFERLKSLFNGLIECDFLLKYDFKNDSKSPLDRAIASFYGFWTVTSSLIKNEKFELKTSEHYDLIKKWSLVTPKNISSFTNLLYFLRRKFQFPLSLRFQNLGKINLSGINLERTTLIGANLSQTNLNGANLKSVDITNAIFDSSILSGSTIRGGAIQSASFYKANLERMDLSGAPLKKTYLFGANFFRTTLRNAVLKEANLTKAKMEETNLQNAKLQKAILKDAYLDNSNLYEANLSYSDSRDASFRDANMKNTNLGESNLTGAKFIGAKISGTNFQGADLSGTDFRGAEIDEMYVRNANLNKAIFYRNSIKNISGLESAKNYSKIIIVEEMLKMK